MERVRVKSGVPVASDFADKVGTPIVIDSSTGNAYVMTDAGVIMEFAATALPVSDVWVPTLSFATPGDLNVVYSERAGFYVKVGQLVMVSFHMLTSTFTHTTAAGNLLVSGVPFAPSGLSLYTSVGACRWQGITFAGARVGSTQIVTRITNAQTFFFDVSGSGIASAQVLAADMPTGGTVIVRGGISYMAAA